MKITLANQIALIAVFAVIVAAGCSRPESIDNARAASAPPVATPSPSPPASRAQPEAASPSLPRSAAEILAELRRRGYTLQSVDAPPPSKGATGYRVEGLPAAVVFHEREGRLAAVNVALLKTGPSTNAAAALDFAEIVGESATGRSRDTTRQAIAQTMNAVGKSAGRMSCSFGAEGKGFRLETVRHDDGGFSFVFGAEAQ